MVRFGVVAALLRLLLLREALRQGTQLAIGLAAGMGQSRKGAPYAARVDLGEVEVRLLVAQNGAPLRVVVQDHRLDPRLPGAETRDRAEFEALAPTLPGVIQRVGGLGPFRPLGGGRALEVVPGEGPRGGPGERMVVGQVTAHQVIERTGPPGDGGGRGGRSGCWIFFFQAEDGIRDLYVTGVQTCALPI